MIANLLAYHDRCLLSGERRRLIAEPRIGAEQKKASNNEVDKRLAKPRCHRERKYRVGVQMAMARMALFIDPGAFLEKMKVARAFEPCAREMHGQLRCSRKLVWG